MTHLWLTSLALVALGQRLCHGRARKNGSFTVAELLAWAPDLRQEHHTHRACNMLAHAGLLEATPPTVDNPGANKNPTRPTAWRLTAAGREAAHAAQLEAASRKRSETMAIVNQQRTHADSLANRLWTVLRTRRALTGNEAVELLGDAGDSTDALRKQVGKYLAAWHALLPQTVQVSARKVGHSRRFVLVGDAGRFPPQALRNAEHRARALAQSDGKAPATESQA